METLKLLATFNNEIEAQVVKAKLAEAGIESLLRSADTDNMLPMLDFITGVGIYVEPDDLSVAQGLIGSGSDDLDDDMEVGVGD
ncbi:MAG TPA: DUF2007 domain-containing protein [Candidatus Kapabacteria bacterium]|nr:DUF2007 domain-containing protein [Candidatus Kapabacteria bacterium]